jgi:hypothetical protein
MISIAAMVSSVRGRRFQSKTVQSSMRVLSKIFKRPRLANAHVHADDSCPPPTGRAQRDGFSATRGSAPSSRALPDPFLVNLRATVVCRAFSREPSRAPDPIPASVERSGRKMMIFFEND